MTIDHIRRLGKIRKRLKPKRQGYVCDPYFNADIRERMAKAGPGDAVEIDTAQWEGFLESTKKYRTWKAWL